MNKALKILREAFIKPIYQSANLFKNIERYYSFCNIWGAHRGAHSSFDEAMKHKPQDKPFNAEKQNFESIKEAINNLRDSKIRDLDYPFMFWLSHLIEKEKISSTFDLGGQYGAHYFCLLNYFKKEIKWEVCETNWAVEIGNKIKDYCLNSKDFNSDSKNKDFIEKIQNLSFTNDFSNVKNFDMLASSGAILCIENAYNFLETNLKANSNNGGGGGKSHTP